MDLIGKHDLKFNSNKISGYQNSCDFSELKGQKVIDIFHDDEKFQILTEKYLFELEHDQDCCEHVYLQDIVGDINDLVGHEILLAEESTSDENPLCEYDDSFTWTFYKLATIKGYIDLRWYGSSNGYYSEDVSCYKNELV